MHTILQIFLIDRNRIHLVKICQFEGRILKNVLTLKKKSKKLINKNC